MIADDSLRDGQAESRSFPDLLGGEERLENPFQELLRDPRPLVGHVDVKKGVSFRSFDSFESRVRTDLVTDDEPTTRRGRLQPIDDEVGDRLLDLERVEVPLRRPAALDREGQSASLGEGAEEAGGLLEDLADVVPRLLPVPPPREVQELADDGRHLSRLIEDDGGVVVRRGARFVSVQDELGAPVHDREGRPELVPDSRRQLSDGRQPIGMAELLESGDSLRSLELGSLAGGGKLLPHRIHFSRELTQLVSLSQNDLSRKVAGSYPSRLLHEHPDGLAHQKNAERDRENPGDRGRGPDGERGLLDLPPPEISLQMQEAFLKLHRSPPAVGSPDRDERLSQLRAVPGGHRKGHGMPPLQSLDLAGLKPPSAGRLLVQPPPTRPHASRVGFGVQNRERLLGSGGFPDAGHRGGELGPQEEVILRQVPFHEAQLPLRAYGRGPGQDDEDGNPECERDFQREPHLRAELSISLPSFLIPGAAWQIATRGVLSHKPSFPRPILAARTAGAFAVVERARVLHRDAVQPASRRLPISGGSSTLRFPKSARIWLTVAGIVPAGTEAFSQESAVQFENATEVSGFVSLPEVGGHGIQVVDVDGDGWLDIYVTNIYNDQQDRRDLLFINRREPAIRFSEVGVERAVEDDGFYAGSSNETHAAIFADLDNDGDFNLYNARTWNGSNRLYRNDGAGAFVDLSESAGIDVTDLGTRGVGAGDFDGNGFLDILVSAWQGAQPIVYWNSGGMHFERERVHGVDDRWPANQGATVADVDGDGLQDVALTSFEYDKEETVGPITILLNTGDKRFRDATQDLGFHYPRADKDYRGTNGFSFIDIDNDGDLDAFIAGYHGSALYRNDDGRFRMIQQFEGVHYTGAFGDVDNDGDLDLYITGERGDFVEGIFVNDGRGALTLLPGVVGGVGNDARAGVFADLNNDGTVELIIASKQGVNTLFRNRSARTSAIQIALVGPNGEAGALGARVRLFAAGHLGALEYLRGMREVRGSNGYCAQESPRLHFGIEAASSYDVEVRFTNGMVVTRTSLGPGIHTIDARTGH